MPLLPTNTQPTNAIARWAAVFSNGKPPTNGLLLAESVLLSLVRCWAITSNVMIIKMRT